MSKEPRHFETRPEDADRRVEKFLASCLPRAAAGHVEKLLRQGRVLLERRSGGPLTARRGDRLTGRERVVVLPAEQRTHKPPQPNRKIRFRVLHEDPDLALVVKPGRIAMHPGPGHGTDTFLNALVGRFPEMLELGAEREFGLVHRLDRDTSGVVVVARTPAAYTGLVERFAAREVEKEYLALVAGCPPQPEGEVSEPVDGKEAHTRYEVAGRAGPVTLVRLHPRTGRTHQVRIHLARLGCPVLRDDRYGSGEDETTAQIYLARLALHARRLALVHPVTGEPLAGEREMPRDLQRPWKRALKLWGEDAD